MELCDICGNSLPIIWEAGEHKVCEICKEQLKDHVGQKCLNCGAYGFIPVNQKNIDRVMYFFNLTKEALAEGDVVIIWEDCPNCGGIGRRKEAISKTLRS